MSGALAGEDTLAGAALAQWGTKWNDSEENSIAENAVSNSVLSAYETKTFKYLGEVKEIDGKTMYKFLDKTGIVVWLTTPVEMYSNHETYSKSYVYAADGVTLLGIAFSAAIMTNVDGSIETTATVAGAVGGVVGLGTGYIKAKFIPKKSEEERVQEKEEYDQWFDGLYDSAKNGELPD